MDYNLNGAKTGAKKDYYNFGILIKHSNLLDHQHTN